MTKQLKLFGMAPRVVGLVSNIDRTTDSAEIGNFGPSGVEQLNFDIEVSEANVITSIVGDPKLKLFHMPVLDLDIPARLIPSSTPGHSHLYVDKALTWTQYKDLLNALAAAGIIEDGYAGASIARGHTAVRLPWVSKENRAADPTSDDVEPF